MFIVQVFEKNEKKKMKKAHCKVLQCAKIRFNYCFRNASTAFPHSRPSTIALTTRL